MKKITYKDAPEYNTLDDFIEYLIDDELDHFTHHDLEALNFRLRLPVHQIKACLIDYGFKLAVRPIERNPRGFTTSSNDRWYGPGSMPTHGGAGFKSIFE